MDEKFLPELVNTDAAMKYLGLAPESDKYIFFSLIAERKIKARFKTMAQTIPITSEIVDYKETILGDEKPFLKRTREHEIEDYINNALIKECIVGNSKVIHDPINKTYSLGVVTAYVNGNESYFLDPIKDGDGEEEETIIYRFEIRSLVYPPWSNIKVERESLVSFMKMEEDETNTGKMEQVKPHTNIKQKNNNGLQTELLASGLLIHYLAQNEGLYKTGGTINNQRVKDRLMELADEIGVSNYGLTKANERIIKDALNYLEERKK